MTIFDKIAGYYPLNGNTDDVISAYGRGGGDVPGLTWGTGKIDQCAIFDGGCEIEAWPVYEISADAGMSCFLWIKNSVSSWQDIIYDYYNDIFYFSLTADGYLYLYVEGMDSEGNYTYKDLYTSANLADGAWHHVGFTFKNNILKVYVDGVSLTLSFDTNDDITDFNGGELELYIGDGFEGSIDEILIANDELTPTEVSDLYNSGDGLSIVDLGGSDIVTDLPLSDKVYLYYPLGGSPWEESKYGSKSLVAYVVGVNTNGVIGSCAQLMDTFSYYLRTVSGFTVWYPFKLSVFVWIKPDSPHTAIMDILYHSAFSMSLDTSGRVHMVIEADDGNIKEYYTQQSLANDTWYYVGFTFDNNELVLYLNGRAVPYTVVTNEDVFILATVSDKLEIGYVDGSANSRLNGWVDELLIANDLLSRHEVSWLYNSGSGREFSTLTDYSFTFVVAYQSLALSLDACWVHQSLPGNMIDPFYNFQSTITSSGDELLQLLIPSLGDELLQLLITSSGDEHHHSVLSALGTGKDQSLSVGFPVFIMQKIINRVGWYLSVYQSMINLLSRGDQTEANQAVLPILPNEVRAGQGLINTLSEQIYKYQKAINLLSRGDNTEINQSVLPLLPNGVDGNQGLITTLSEQIDKYQKVLNLLSRGDNTEANQELIPILPDEARRKQSIIASLSEEILKVQSAMNLLSRGDQTESFQAILKPLPDAHIDQQKSISSLSDAITVLQKQLNILSGDPSASYQQLIQTISENADVYAIQKIGIALNDLTSQYFSTAAEIYLDGRPLSSRFVTAEFIYDESNVHNSLTITSADPELFIWSDPDTQYGESRIEVQVGGRVIYFIIDTRPGEQSGFVINCLSVSAKEDGPFCDSIDYQLETPTLASEIADSLTNYCPVDWQATDWVVPIEFNFSGYPLDGIQTLASEIGAIVRCQDDGSLLVRDCWPVRPVDMETAIPDISYDQSLLVSLSNDEESESGYNAVQILGYSPDVFIPQMLLEDVEDGPYIGDTVYIRVYWEGNPVTVISTYVTDGLLTLIGSGAYYEQTEEVVVEFKEGVASVSLPIYDLSSWEWIGDSGGDITYTQFGTELGISDEAFRVATIKYVSRYRKYSASKHNVEQLIAVLFLESGNEIDVSVQTADDPIWMTSVSAPLLTDENAATKRGTAEIDSSKYRKSILSIEAPYYDVAIDGNIAYINDDQIGHPGNYHIASSKVIFDGPKITNQLEIKKCLISFNS